MDFKLRPWKTDDIERLVVIANNKNISDNLTNRFPHPYTRESGEGFIAMAMSETPPLILAIEVNGLLAGGIGLHPQQDIFFKNAELGYWLAEDFWGKGIMTKAVEQIVIYGFKNLEINRIFARPFHTNIGSQKVLEKCHFLLEAKLEKTICKNGTYYDELIYAIRR